MVETIMQQNRSETQLRGHQLHRGPRSARQRKIFAPTAYLKDTQNPQPTRALDTETRSHRRPIQ
jgi:hypothetical protein